MLSKRMRLESESSRLRSCEMLAMAAALGFAPAAYAGFNDKDTKILDFSWDTPSPPILNSQVSSSAGQQQPFDGVITDLLQNNPTYGYGDPRDLLAWKVWGPQSLNSSTFSQAISALNTTHFGRLDQ